MESWHRRRRVCGAANLLRQPGSGKHFAAGGAIVAPTGKESEGLGNGFWTYEPFAMWGQMIGPNAFFQVHAGVEFPSDQALGDTEAFARTAFG